MYRRGGDRQEANTGRRSTCLSSIKRIPFNQAEDYVICVLWRVHRDTNAPAANIWEDAQSINFLQRRSALDIFNRIRRLQIICKKGMDELSKQIIAERVLPPTLTGHERDACDAVDQVMWVARPPRRGRGHKRARE